MKLHFDATEASVGQVVVIVRRGESMRTATIKKISPKRLDVTLNETDKKFNRHGIEKTDDIWSAWSLSFVTDDVKEFIAACALSTEANRKLANIKCFLNGHQRIDVAQAVLKGCEVIKEELDKIFLKK